MRKDDMKAWEMHGDKPVEMHTGLRVMERCDILHLSPGIEREISRDSNLCNTLTDISPFFWPVLTIKTIQIFNNLFFDPTMYKQVKVLNFLYC